MVFGYSILLCYPGILCEVLDLLADQTVLSAVVHQVVVTLLAHLNAMDCPAHTIPALAEQV